MNTHFTRLHFAHIVYVYVGFNLTKLSNEGFDSVWDFYFSYDKKLVDIFKHRNKSGKYEHTTDDENVKKSLYF